MSIGAALGAGSIVSGIIGGSAAKKAGKAQAQAANSQLALQREQFDKAEENFAPFLGAGENALSALLFELGLGPAPTIGGTAPEIVEFEDTPAVTTQESVPGPAPRDLAGGQSPFFLNRTDGPVTKFRVGDQVFNTRDAAQAFADANPTGGTTFNGLQATPAALFALEQGRDTIEAGAAARGGLNSGATLAGLEKLRFGLSAQDRENQLNRLAGLVDSGQGAAGQQASAGNAFAAQGSNALANLGNARSAGIIGQNNSFQNAFSNLAGVAGFQGGSGGSGGFGSLSDLFRGPAPGSANSLGL